MRHSISNHDQFPSKLEQGKYYVCDGRDLIKPTQDQYDRYKDGSHRGKKKLEEVEKAEQERKRAEVRTKAGEMNKRGEVASTSKDVDLAELMRRSKVKVEILNEGKIEARRREKSLEQERATAEKKIHLEEQQKTRDEKKKRVREEWLRQTRLVEEEKKRG